MDSAQFEKLKADIVAAKERKARAEGTMESIQSSWKDSFGVSTEEEVSALIDQRKAEIAENDEILKDLYADLEEVIDWKSA